LLAPRDKTLGSKFRAVFSSRLFFRFVFLDSQDVLCYPFPFTMILTSHVSVVSHDQCSASLSTRQYSVQVQSNPWGVLHNNSSLETRTSNLQAFSFNSTAAFSSCGSLIPDSMMALTPLARAIPISLRLIPCSRILSYSLACSASSFRSS